MELKLFLESKGQIQDNPVNATLKHRVLNINGEMGDAIIKYSPKVKAWTDGRFNIEIGFSAIYDQPKEYYYIKANTILKYRILWQFGKCWVQQGENQKWLISGIGGFVMGFITKLIFGC